MSQKTILAVAAHPDDVELGVGGILHKHGLIGDECFIIDLTAGQMGTRGTPEIRKQEATHAAEILGLKNRFNLGMQDGQLASNTENKRTLIEYIRRLKPHILLTPSKVERHPDHEAAYRLCKEAFFLSGLKKYPAQGTPWRPKLMMSYIQERWVEPDLIIDISTSFDFKLKSIEAHKSQFYQENTEDTPTLISTQNFWKNIEARSRVLGARIGSEYAEGLTTEDAPGLNSLEDLFLRDLS